MEYCYLMFNTSTLNKETNCSFVIKRIKRIKNTLIKAISTILPSSFFDYDEVINYAEKWLVEFEKKTEHPNREIGIDRNNKIITISPWDGRYAYWADISFKLSDFKRQFNAIDINRQEFEHLWNSFKLRQRLQ